MTRSDKVWVRIIVVLIAFQMVALLIDPALRAAVLKFLL